MGEIVPLRIDVEQKQEVRHQWRQSYRTACTPDAEWQRCKLEALRYKWGGYKDGFRVMQLIADTWERWTGVRSPGRWLR